MPLTIIRNDITKMNVDAIVNAANTELKAGGGVCGAIFSTAGADKLQKACDKLAPIKTGGAVVTRGFALPAKYVIHAAGPVYKDGKHNEEALLRSCYTKSLDLAKKRGCESIAFPLISSGIFGYPKDEALSVATSAIRDWLMKNDMDVSLVVFDKAAFALSNELLGDIKSYIDQNYVDERNLRYARRQPPPWDGRKAYESEALSQTTKLFDAEERKASIDKAVFSVESPASAMPDADYKTYQSGAENMYSHQERCMQSLPPVKALKHDDYISKLDEPFAATLLRLIDTKGKTDVEVYKRANLDRKLFSKIRNGKGYMPSKKTVVALAIALELSLSETRNLLECAGFALSRSVVFDVIIEYFITKRTYDIFDINNVLFEYDQPLLGG